MNKDNRPLSPHLQIYKLPLVAITSILHRITGVALYVGLILLCGLISYYTYQVNIFDEGVPTCDCVVIKSIIYIVMFCWTFALYYHLCNGIRHLFWDMGKGFEIQAARRSGVIVLITASLLTLASFYCVFIN